MYFKFKINAKNKNVYADVAHLHIYCCLHAKQAMEYAANISGCKEMNNSTYRILLDRCKMLQEEQ